MIYNFNVNTEVFHNLQKMIIGNFLIITAPLYDLVFWNKYVKYCCVCDVSLFLLLNRR